MRRPLPVAAPSNRDFAARIVRVEGPPNGDGRSTCTLLPDMAERQAGFGDFLVWLLLGIITFGIYPSWWIFMRLEHLYRVSRRD